MSALTTTTIDAQRTRNTSLYANPNSRPLQATQRVARASASLPQGVTLTAGDTLDLAFLNLGKVKIIPESTRIINPTAAPDIAAVFTLQKVDAAGLVTNLTLPATLAANALVAFARNFRAWLTTTVYVVGDVVTNSTASYVCLVAHTSGTFATDLAAGKWQALASTDTVPQVETADYLRLLVGTVTTSTALGGIEIEVAYTSEEAP